MTPGSRLFVSSADLKDAFYHFELPACLGTYFGMRMVNTNFLKLADDHPFAGQSIRAFPRLKVLPMGWTHALWRRQHPPEDRSGGWGEP